MDGGRMGTSKVRIKVFVGNSSLLRRTFILLTDVHVTPCEDRFSHISSSLTPSSYLHLMTPFDELREAYDVTLIGTLQKIVDLRRQVECFSEWHSTSDIRRWKVRNIGVDPLEGPIRVAFILFCTHNGVIEIHQPCPHPPPSPTRGHAAADNLQSVMPGIHGWYTQAIKV